MPALETPSVNTNWKAAPFTLESVDGRSYSLQDLCGEKGLLLVFMCNHCPYVKAQIDRIIRDAKELESYGIKTVAISSNDAASYPEDSLENMRTLAREKQFPFPYLYDESQSVAKAYGAVCTPDFFGFNAALELQYRGRLDESWSLVKSNPKRELFEAMVEIAKTGKGPALQASAIGCSIKWKQSGEHRNSA